MNNDETLGADKTFARVFAVDLQGSLTAAAVLCAQS